jgi:hypothetical protein
MSSGPTYYRGGPSLAPRRVDVRIDRATGLLQTIRGVSISDRPDGLERFGGAFVVAPLPPTLHVVKTGKNPHRFEIAPAVPMTFDEYDAELAKVTLTPV